MSDRGYTTHGRKYRFWEQGYFKSFKSLEVETEKEIAERTRAIA